jgi:hypothetical protein
MAIGREMRTMGGAFCVFLPVLRASLEIAGMAISKAAIACW